MRWGCASRRGRQPHSSSSISIPPRSGPCDSAPQSEQARSSFRRGHHAQGGAQAGPAMSGRRHIQHAGQQEICFKRAPQRNIGRQRSETQALRRSGVARFGLAMRVASHDPFLKHGAVLGAAICRPPSSFNTCGQAAGLREQEQSGLTFCRTPGRCCSCQQLTGVLPPKARNKAAGQGGRPPQQRNQMSAQHAQIDVAVHLSGAAVLLRCWATGARCRVCLLLR
jgi:hypothetical protein